MKVQMTNAELAEAIEAASQKTDGIRFGEHPRTIELWSSHLKALLDVQLERAKTGEIEPDKQPGAAT